MNGRKMEEINGRYIKRGSDDLFTHEGGGVSRRRAAM